MDPSFYRERINVFETEENRHRRRATAYAAFRLLTAALILLGLWQGIRAATPLAYLLPAAFALVFTILVRLHGRAQEQRVYFRRLKEINERELKALGGHREMFPGGDKYIDPAHPFSYDLDIFGRNSVFQLVNRTSCASAEVLLHKTLTSPPGGADGIIARQEAIAELAPMADFRHHFMAAGQAVAETSEETGRLLAWLTAPASTVNTPAIRLLCKLLPAAAILLLLLAAAGLVPHTAWITAVLLNLLITGIFLKQVNRVHAGISRQQLLLEKFGLLLERTGSARFNSSLLRSLSAEGAEASRAIRSLAKIAGFFDQRLNLMVGAVLNGFLLSDLNCVLAIDRWRAVHRDRMPHWLNSIFRIDELGSFANFAFNHPAYCRPEFRETPFITAEKLGHPLLPPGQCVPNSFSSAGGENNAGEEKVVILTGANMSGKSTFLRSLGVNLVLAYAGAPVFADRFICCLAGIHTSMRVSDSLSEDTSYFYAELKRLSTIMSGLRAGRKMFILLDEILKGTNSADKLQGSTGLIEEFIGHDCLSVVATHDLELGKLEAIHPGAVSNYCFESILEGDRLHFDYLLKRGVARNRNASFLMKKMDLIP